MDLTAISLEPVKSGGILMPAITNGFRLLESSYAKGINRQLNRSGNLLQQKTKAKFTNEAKDYSATAFHYIHQDPVRAASSISLKSGDILLIKIMQVYATEDSAMSKRHLSGSISMKLI